MGERRIGFRLVLSVLLLFFFTHCRNSEKKIDLKAESIKIYKLIIYNFYSNSENETVLINNYNLPIKEMFSNQLSSHPEIDQDTLKDFFNKNRSVNYIACDFPLDTEYRFLSFKDDWKDIGYNLKLRNFMHRVKKLSPYLDKKIIAFSKVGFNKKADQAIVTFIIYSIAKPDEADPRHLNDDVLLPLPGIALLEKKLGPPPHVWTIKNPHLEYHN